MCNKTTKRFLIEYFLFIFLHDIVLIHKPSLSVYIHSASQFLLRLLESSEISVAHASTVSSAPETDSPKIGSNHHHQHPLVGSSGFLNNRTAEHLLGMLHRATNRLFQQAAVNHFSLPELIVFIRALLSASREVTFPSDPNLVSAEGPSLLALDPFGVNPMLDRYDYKIVTAGSTLFGSLLFMLYQLAYTEG